MKQTSLATTGYELITKRTRKRIFLEEMNLVVPWTELVGLIQPHSSPEPTSKGGRPAFRVETMFIPMYWQFAQLDPGITRLPDETTILRFRHLLQANNLSLQIMGTINALLTQHGLMLKTGNVVGTSGNVHDVTQGNNLLHGQESVAFGDAGYQGVEKRTDAQSNAKAGIQWHIAMRPGKRKALNKDNEADALIDKAEKLKAGIRAKVEHPFRVIKRQFGFMKVRYRGL
jgi:IS5 family transposase